MSSINTKNNTNSIHIADCQNRMSIIYQENSSVDIREYDAAFNAYMSLMNMVIYNSFDRLGIAGLASGYLLLGSDIKAKGEYPTFICFCVREPLCDIMEAVYKANESLIDKDVFIIESADFGENRKACLRFFKEVPDIVSFGMHRKPSAIFYVTAAARNKNADMANDKLVSALTNVGYKLIPNTCVMMLSCD